MVGLYLTPLAPAAQLRRDRKRSHDHKRHGATNLFAALNITTGEVFGECKPTCG
ncbi:hypothetical protein JNUCC0626_47965 [Lentzea sp. JNUCC 0626]|uniref:hypothetical protein n=1 Tax=Lentzea sp. JNUCC 0626 TaxID=3367513 RepID=UPI003749DE4A